MFSFIFVKAQFDKTFEKSQCVTCVAEKKKEPYACEACNKLVSTKFYLKRLSKAAHEAAAEAAEGSLRTDHTRSCKGCCGSFRNVGNSNNMLRVASHKRKTTKTSLRPGKSKDVVRKWSK